MNSSIKPLEVVGFIDTSNMNGIANSRIDATKMFLEKHVEGLNIINTEQTRRPEYYGWYSPVPQHVDNTGFIYFIPFYIESKDVLVVDGIETELQVGAVYRLNDSVPHGSLGDGRVAALFNGSYSAEEITESLDKSILWYFNRELNVD